MSRATLDHIAAVHSSFLSQSAVCMVYMYCSPWILPSSPLVHVALHAMTVVTTTYPSQSHRCYESANQCHCGRRQWLQQEHASCFLKAWWSMQGQAAGGGNCKVSMSIFVTCAWSCLAMLTMNVLHPLFSWPSQGTKGQECFFILKCHNFKPFSWLSLLLFYIQSPNLKQD